MRKSTSVRMPKKPIWEREAKWEFSSWRRPDKGGKLKDRYNTELP